MRNGVRIAAVFLLLLLCAVQPVRAEVRATVPSLDNAQPIGGATMRFLFWDVYDASLYTPDAQPFSFDRPFALQLHYHMALASEEIAQRSAREMRGLGVADEVALAAWYRAMETLFPDVAEGDQLMGIYRPNQPVIFYHNEQKIGEIDDSEFGRYFFAIWLDEKTSEPEFRGKLLGADQ